MKEYIKNKIIEYGKSVGYVTAEDWYKGYPSTYLNITSYKFYKEFDSPSDAIRYCFPDFNFLEWKFKKVKSGWWDGLSNQKEYLKWFCGELNVTNPEDWYNITTNDIYSNNGGQLLSKYNNSIKKIGKVIFPKFNFKFWKYKCSSMSDWDNISNQKEYLEWFENEMNINKPEDWLNITSVDIINNSGATLIAGKYNNSIQNILKSLRPNYNLNSWDFRYLPKNFWKVSENKKEYLEWFENEMNINKPEDWLSIKTTDLSKRHGIGLVRECSNSLKTIFEILYDVCYEEWEFATVIEGLWLDKKNVLGYINWVERELNINCLEDWYRYSKNDLLKLKGSNIFKHHTLLSLLEVKYSNIYFWKFKQSLKNVYEDKSNKLKYLKWFENENKITKPDDWYNVTYKNLNDNYGHTILKKFEMSIQNIAKFLYPKYKFDNSKFYSNLKTQGIIYNYIIKFFETEGFEYIVKFNYKSHLLFKSSGRKMEFDIYIPELNLVIEYNGRQHYEYVEYFHCSLDSLHEQQNRDKEKYEYCDKEDVNMEVIRFDDNVNYEFVCDIIRKYLQPRN